MAMRMMLKARMDTEAANRKLQDGTMGELLQKVMGSLNPEAAYFGPTAGGRCAYIVFDMADPSMLPAVSEPFFTELNADVDIFPVMDRDDLQKGIAQLG
jgi:hypothetical protein